MHVPKNIRTNTASRIETIMQTKGRDLNGQRSRRYDRFKNLHPKTKQNRDYSAGSDIFLTHDALLRSYKDGNNNANLRDLLYDDEHDDDFDRPEESVYKEILENFIIKVKLQSSKQIRRIGSFFTINLIVMATVILLICSVSLLYNKSSFSFFREITNATTFIDQPADQSPLHKIIVPYLNQLFPDKVLEDEDLFDPRLAPALLLLYLQFHIIGTKKQLEQSFSIPFSWEDWVDIDAKLQYDDDYLIEWLALHSNDFWNQLDDFNNLSCETFALLYGCENNRNFMSKCRDLDDNIPGYPYKFEVTGPTNAKMKEPGRILYGAMYLKSKMPPPQQIYLLDVCGENGEGSLMIKVDPDKNAKRTQVLRNKEIIMQLIDWEVTYTKKNMGSFLDKGWNIETLRKRMSSVLTKFGVEKIISYKRHKDIDRKQTFLTLRESTDHGVVEVSSWDFDDFRWDEEQFWNDLIISSFNGEEGNYDGRLYTRLEESENFRIRKGFHPKYLYEADIYGITEGSHYDWRFFSGSFMTSDHRQSVIHKLSRTWLRFCFENNLKTFIAYGSMLGWIRNGLTLPWDEDIDVIVTMETLNLLARNFNQTLIVDYSSKDGFQSAATGFLVDINPAYYSRVKGDGNNVIDGRLIDISTGLYLDITALAWTKDYLREVQMHDKLKRLVDKDYEVNRIFALEGDIYGQTLMEQLAKLQEDHELIHCKNDNVYTVSELSVMIPSYFEGARAFFPQEYEKIIWRLYPKALTRITEPDHVFDGVYRLWLNIHDCPAMVNEFGTVYVNAPFGTCNNSRVIHEYNLTQDYTARHLSMLEEGDWESYKLEESTESKPFRIDEFFFLYAARIGLPEDELVSSCL